MSLIATSLVNCIVHFKCPLEMSISLVNMYILYTFGQCLVWYRASCMHMCLKHSILPENISLFFKLKSVLLSYLIGLYVAGCYTLIYGNVKRRDKEKKNARIL